MDHSLVWMRVMTNIEELIVCALYKHYIRTVDCGVVCCGDHISVGMCGIRALNSSNWSILCMEWVCNGPPSLGTDIWPVGGPSGAGSFWEKPRCILFGAFLFRPEVGNEKVISFSSQPFRARIYLQFGVLSTLLAALLAKLWPDFYQFLDLEHILDGFRTECHWIHCPFVIFVNFPSWYITSSFTHSVSATQSLISYLLSFELVDTVKSDIIFDFRTSMKP